MCVRNAYQCPQCKLVFAMPLCHTPLRRVLCRWLRLAAKKQESRVDLICKNNSCLRRTEEGYLLCLNMKEPCWFCLRFGHEYLCFNRTVSVLCRQCFVSSGDSTQRSARYPSPLHCRRPERTTHDFLYTDLFEQPRP